jgi:hypothetical protein
MDRWGGTIMATCSKEGEPFLIIIIIEPMLSFGPGGHKRSLAHLMARTGEIKHEDLTHGWFWVAAPPNEWYHDVDGTAQSMHCHYPMLPNLS